MVTDCKFLCAVLIVFTAALCIPPAARAADNSEIEFYAGGFLGQTFTGTQGPFLVLTDAVFDDHFTGGFRYSYFLTRRLAVEGGLGFTPASISSHGTISKMDTYVFQANGLYHLWNGPIVPFVTGGVAAVHFNVKPPAFFSFGPSETDFAWIAGAGAKIPFRRNAAFRLDGRFYWMQPKFAPAQTKRFTEISGGLSISFDL